MAVEIKPFHYTTPTHWADKYRGASRTTLEGWVYLAACHCTGPEEWIREVGRIAYTTQCCIWHAAWVASGRKGTCGCADCARARKTATAA